MYPLFASSCDNILHGDKFLLVKSWLLIKMNSGFLKSNTGFYLKILYDFGFNNNFSVVNHTSL